MMVMEMMTIKMMTMTRSIIASIVSTPVTILILMMVTEVIAMRL